MVNTGEEKLVEVRFAILKHFFSLPLPWYQLGRGACFMGEDLLQASLPSFFAPYTYLCKVDSEGKKYGTALNGKKPVN